MDVLEKIIKFIKPYVTNSKKIIIILICTLFLQTIFGLLYTRSLKQNPGSIDEFEQFQAEQQQSFFNKLTFTQSEIAFILQALNISTDDLCQYYQPQVDNIYDIINRKEQELDDLKKQYRNNSESENNLELKSQISFAEEQVIFYKAEASFWEERSKGLRNLIKTLGLDSIMAYLTNRDSVDNTLDELSPPQIIMTKRDKKMAIPKTEPQETNKTTVIDKNPLTPTSFTSEKSVMNEKKTEHSIILPVINQNQAPVISQRELRVMLKKYNFFDYYWNQNGKGFSNKFELQILNGDTVVIDRASRLMWQQSGSLKGMSFENAKKWIEELNQSRFAGYQDWRLPTLREAMTLVEPEKNDVLYMVYLRKNKS